MPRDGREVAVRAEQQRPGRDAGLSDDALVYDAGAWSVPGVRATRSVSARPHESELDAAENGLQLVGGELPVPLERVLALPDLAERAGRGIVLTD